MWACAILCCLSIVGTHAQEGSTAEQVHQVSAFVQEAALRGWHSEGLVPAGDSVELTFAVRQRNLAELARVFQEVSDPDHVNYGRHMSFDEVNGLTAPREQDVAAVEQALAGLGASAVQRTPFGAFLVAEVPVAAAERAFGGRFLRFRHEDGRAAVRCPGCGLPGRLSSAVDFALPLAQQLSRGGPARLRRSQGVSAERVNASFPDALVNTPSSLRKLYSVGNTEARAKNNKQAVTGFLEQYYTNVDLQAFFLAFYKRGLGRKVARKVGDGKSGLAGTEAELDVQYVMSMGGNVETEFWSFAGRAPDNPQNEPFLKFMTTLANTSDAPLVISSSYGEDEDSVSQAYADRCNVEFQKAGVRGISLLFASGDSGVAGDRHCGTLCAAGKECFVPMWPAASPYVTAVGGTGGLGGKEAGASLSSGGFSYRWPVPAWQQDSVSAFLAGKGLPDRSLFSKSGRGFPDISAQAIDYMVVDLGIPMPVSGTSCASPTAAGIISLVNDVRLGNGKPPLGFLNPLFYKNPAALNDVTGGCNPGCGSNGFCAVLGWDPVTGLGTPNYGKLARLAAIGGVGQELVV